jgi:hypothetical protein
MSVEQLDELKLFIGEIDWAGKDETLVDSVFDSLVANDVKVGCVFSRSRPVGCFCVARRWSN